MKTSVRHIRWVETEDGDEVLLPNNVIKLMKTKVRVLPTGGITIVVVDDGINAAVGNAFCSDRDNYNKKLGRMIATGRAMKELGSLS